MSKSKKRAYHSLTRTARAAQTRKRILLAAKNLFETDGFECVTIEKISIAAGVSIPTIYGLFESKRGVLRALMDQVFPKEKFEELVAKSIETKSPEKRLRYSAKIARKLYDAEKAQMELFRGATLLAPEFKEFEKERELRRYERQRITISAMAKEKSLSKNLSIKKARAILWALTGRDLYRLLVIEQKWTSQHYETWLAQLLVSNLLFKR